MILTSQQHIVCEKDIRAFISSREGKLDEDWKYVNSINKFWIQCGKGHKWETCWNWVQSGRWCPECAKNFLVSDDIVRNFIENKGGKLDPDWKYPNNHEKFWIECTQGHRWQAIWSNIRKGSWCPYCSKKRVDEKTIHDYVENKGGHLDQDWKFITSKTKFNIICENGHNFQSCWDKISHDHWCPSCYGNNPVEKTKIEKLIREKDGCLDSDWVYINAFTKFGVTCHKGHKWQAIWASLRNGHWCPHCNDSAVEKRFRETMKHVFSVEFPKQKPDWLRNPSTGRLLELDGYNQVIKTAFEYQGLFHYKNDLHPETFEKQMERDRIKVDLCQKNNVVLVVMPYWIPEKNWKKEINTIISKS